MSEWRIDSILNGGGYAGAKVAVLSFDEPMGNEYRYQIVIEDNLHSHYGLLAKYKLLGSGYLLENTKEGWITAWKPIESS
jgi:hypothetical protein